MAEITAPLQVLVEEFPPDAPIAVKPKITKIRPPLFIPQLAILNKRNNLLKIEI